MLALCFSASGAVTAVIMLFVFLYPHRTILLFMVIPAPAWVLGVIVIALDLFGNRLPGPDGARIALSDVHSPVGRGIRAAGLFLVRLEFVAGHSVGGLAFVDAQ